MKIAENFARCEKCGNGYFEEKVFVLVQKDSPTSGIPLAYQKNIQLQCIGCGHAQYQYNES